MADKVDNPASRQQVRQTQKAQQPHRASRQAGKMSIGVTTSQKARPDFGQLLQDSMSHTSTSVRHNVNPGLPQERGRERETTRSDSSRSQEQVGQRGAQESAGREVHRRGEDSRDNSDSREGRRGSDSRESGQQAREAEQRVVSRQGQGNSHSKGESGQQEGRQGTGGEQGGQQAGGKSAAQTGKMAQPKAVQADALLGAMAQRATRLAGRGLIPPRLSQKMLDQLVQHARLLMNKDGEKEMQLALHEEIFKGLRLRIATRGKKVVATFITSSREIRDLFLSERSALLGAMEEKGVDVEEIDVIMT